MTRLRRFALCLLALVAVALVPAATGRIKSRAGMDAPLLDRLEICAQLEGTARILVGPVGPESQSVPAIIGKLKAAGAAYSNVASYTFTPKFSIRVDLRGLSGLAQMPEVASLEPDPFTTPADLRELYLDAKCLKIAAVGIELRMSWRPVDLHSTVGKRQTAQARKLSTRVIAKLRRHHFRFSSVRRGRYAPNLTMKASAKAIRQMQQFREIRRLFIPTPIIALG